jgi:hypothetical protein
MKTAALRFARSALAAAVIAGLAPHAGADAITDWNLKSHQFITDAKMGTPPAIRALAVVQTAAQEALENLARDASAEAAVAAAHRVALAKMIPSQQAAVQAAYDAALAAVPEGSAKAAGIRAGESAAERVLARRADDAVPPDTYRPHAAAGAYVPTAAAAGSTWGARKPWLMTSPAQFRPAPPPALSSRQWERDFNEVRALGGKASTARTPDQVEIARFWEYSLPAIYHGVLHSVAAMPGRDVKRNARLFAAVAQAMDDAMISVFEAKYHYNFWRPTTAIRNGDADGNDGTSRDASWAPFIEPPMHPEYPSGHAILAGAVAGVLEKEIGQGPSPVLMTTSPTAKGVTRRWTSLADFQREVQDARVLEGIHFRTATDVGVDMGRRIGELAAAANLR